jgi:diaminobutyrate-2-oxoglutarate transaminase
MDTFAHYHLAEDATIISPTLPGEKSKELLRYQRETEGDIVSYPKHMPIAIKRAKGAIIEDVDGNQFIDFFSGCGVLNVGHSNEDVLEAMRQQQNELIHALDFPTQNKADLIAKIMEHVPAQVRNRFKISFCSPSGSDAVEAAIKLAKLKTGRNTIIAFQGSYHGMSSGSLAATSNNRLRQNVEGLMPNVHFVPYGYCYRCPFKKDPASCSLDCADYLHSLLENPHSGISKPAAIILEPIQCEGGNIIPPAGFVNKVIGIARKFDVLVIVDEIQTGFFRTGEFLATQHNEAVADIYTISKGLGGIGLPLSAILYNKDIEAWGTGKHTGTFRGNQLSIAASRGAFDFVVNKNVKAHARHMAGYLMEKLYLLASENRYVGEIRGKGLLIGIELVKDRVTKEPYPELVKRIRKQCFQKGLLFEVGGHYDNVIRFIPPLIITERIVDNAMAIFQSCFEECCETEKSEPVYES